MKRFAPLILVLAACGDAPVGPSGRAQVVFPAGEVIDLSHSYDETTIYWPTAETFSLKVDFAGMTDKGYYYEANSFCSAEHGGTHMDAPIHFAEGGLSIDRVPLEQMIGPAAVIDVTAACAADRDYLVGVSDLTSWESAHGRLPDGSIVLLRTGFEAYWPDRERYMGTSERGPDAVPKLHFPGLDPKAARWLVTERSIKAIGLDTPSIDYGQSTLFESHRTLFEANIPAFENLDNLSQLPPLGSLIVALPIKITGGSGGPLRIIAVVPPA